MIIIHQEDNQRKRPLCLLARKMRTVEKHRSNLMAKLNVYDLPGLVRTATKHRLVFLDE